MAQDTTPAPVLLYLYDLSHGLSQSLSQSIAGTQIDAIWHTSVVVYSKEYFYGQGISTAQPGTTIHGSPVEILPMGDTHIPPDIVEELVDSMRMRFSASQYNLMTFNCNTFSGELVAALTGASIPDKVSSLPARFAESPLGQRLFPARQSKLRTVATYEDLMGAVASGRAVAVFFTSMTCPPCRAIEPAFTELVEKSAVDAVKIDVGVQADVARRFAVRGTPMFLFFFDGERAGEVVGADRSALAEEFKLLEYSMRPPHARIASLPGIEAAGSTCVAFRSKKTLSAACEKLEGCVGHSLAETRADVERALSSHDGAAAQAALAALYDRVADTECAFACVDIVRMLVGAHCDAGAIAARIVRDVARYPGSEREIPPPLAVVTLRLLCNMVADSDVRELRADVVSVMAACLGAPEGDVRRTAAALAFNAAVRADKSDEDWVLELASATAKAFGDEARGGAVQVAVRLVAALVNLVYCGPQSVIELVRMLGISESARGLAGDGEDAELLCLLVADLDALLAATD